MTSFSYRYAVDVSNVAALE